jgi:hypothetical protein
VFLKQGSLARRRAKSHTAVVLADEQATPEQIAVLKRMTPAQRWQAARRLYWTMRKHKTAFVQSQHPDWSSEKVADYVRNIFLRART